MFAAGKTKGASAAAAANYIEDVFSTYLYTGTGAAQTITNGIDLAGKGGLVWLKSRSSGTVNAGSNNLYDTTNGATKYLRSNTTDAQATDTLSLTAFTSTGFSLGSSGISNTNGATLASWTFRKQPKFFDVVTYTGNGTTQNIAHSLGIQPGMLVVKQTSGTGGNWTVWHRSTTAGYRLVLNSTNAESNSVNANFFGNNTTYVDPTSSVFTVGSNTTVNATGENYVAYLFAHNAGGFGLTGTDNVISCGSFTTDGSGNATVTLGYEPQWVMCKTSSTAGAWQMLDTMRGWTNSSAFDPTLLANSSGAETADTERGSPTATGFTYSGSSISQTFVYIAIRRGPMKTPTSGTSVFAPVTRSGTSTNNTVVTAGIAPDIGISLSRNQTRGKRWIDKLRGVNIQLDSTNTNAEVTAQTDTLTAFTNTGVVLGGDSTGFAWNNSGTNYIQYYMQRAPGFFDEVCYTGTSTNPTVLNHNLTVAPELIICKRRSGPASWTTFCNMTGSTFNRLFLETTAAATSWSYSNVQGLAAAPTATTFTLDDSSVNASGYTYVAYLFASCPGVSKVFSFTGNGTTQTINCGFTGGARFVLLKASSSTGGWYVYDTARGMTTLTDPYLFLNSTAAETATLGSVTTVTGGFAVNEAITTGVNTNGVTYIGLAIA